MADRAVVELPMLEELSHDVMILMNSNGSLLSKGLLCRLLALQVEFDC